MRRSIFIDLLKLVGIFGLIWIVFIIWNPDFSEDETLKISISNEESLGEIIMEELTDRADFSVVKEPAFDSAMHLITGRLLKSMDLTEYDYNILVVHNNQINAITLPGGNIIVFSGLIKFTSQPEELAAILAHEIGHVEHRHIVDKLLREFGLIILTSILGGGDAVLINELGKTIISSTFGRKQESEADQYALQLLEKAQISPRAIASLFRKMNRENLDYNENLELIKSHPHNNARIKASLQYKVKEDFEEKPFDFDWEEVKEAI